MEGKVDFNVDIEDAPMVEMPKATSKKTTKQVKTKPVVHTEEEDGPVSCLRNERVIVRLIKRTSGLVQDPKHVLFGGMAEAAKVTLVVPRLHSGVFVNVLTDSEKEFLEEYMGLEYNSLSIYKRPDEENFWNDANPNGINQVTLYKRDNYLDLSNPQDYIKYKILLANKNVICPSLKHLRDYPSASYKFVIVSEGEESRTAKDNMSNTMLCYKEYGKIENDVMLLRMLIETLDGRPTSPDSQLEFLQTKCNELIQADSRRFADAILDPLLKTKAMIKQSIETGIITNRGNYLYLRSDNTPLCENNEEPTLSVAAKYLNSPKHQDILFAIQAKLNQ